ncbi:MAG TPA: thioesterase [Flavobacteriales bacterium]|nr:thioesterase [Flavobacteriales bacterium]
MIRDEIKIRVRYSETDKMGYVYYGNYAAYFEVARVEMLRELGFTYKKMEDDGIFLPVADFHIKYLKPAYYDDELTIVIKITDMPSSKIRFEYETFNQDGVLLNTAETVLVFFDGNTKRPCRAPQSIQDRARPYFS